MFFVFFASLLFCGGTSLVMLSKFDVSNESALTTRSLGLMLSSANGSDKLEPFSKLEQYLKKIAYH